MSKVVIYQLLPRLFGNTKSDCIPNGSMKENGSGKFDDITVEALTAIKRLSVTHIWLTGVLEHASTTAYPEIDVPSSEPSLVKGKAGSPYAIRDYYDVSPDLANDVSRRMEEFLRLVERCHSIELKVIIDFVPNHVSRQYVSDAKPVGVEDFGAKDNSYLAFSPQNNFYYLPKTRFTSPVQSAHSEEPAKATGNDCFVPNPAISDWYETVKLNYGVDLQHGGEDHFDPIPDTWYKMLDVLSFWTDKGVDGFRCDMAEMVPSAFWTWVIPQIKKRETSPIFLAEIYKPYLYRGYVKSGFDYLYDKVGLYDTLREVLCGTRPASDVSCCWQRLGDLQPFMLNFLENHDEQRITSDFFLGNPLKSIPALVVSSCLNTAPFLLYAGQEFGERGMDHEGFSGVDGRTSIFDYWSMDTLRRFNNAGKWNEYLLSDEEKQIYALYLRLFSLISSSFAIDNGATFDLGYANQNCTGFNTEKHFAFLRHAKTPVKETLLIVANFGDTPSNLRITIPPHAFEFLEIPDGVVHAEQIPFTTEPETPHQISGIYLSSTAPFPVAISAFGAVILKLN